MLTFSNTLEQRVAERTAELERSNRELDRFAYVASHDLKSPLQGMEHLAAWIEEDARDSLSPTAQRYLATLRQRARRLQIMLDDLLYYARAGRCHPLELVRTGELVENVAELLDMPRGFRVQVEGELPTLVCARRPLEIVLYHLIENAVKHHDRPQQGTAIISARMQGDYVEFRVCDDGPGIAPQYHGRIFDIFQTLRPRDEVEGSGMGLAIAKKTVESAGGGIWVESGAGRGATFCFTWPQAAPTAR